MPAYEVTELYRRRWDIEVFFKFIKQNLGYKHFLSHAMNRIKVSYPFSGVANKVDKVV